jgi:elongator complex protein 3
LLGKAEDIVKNEFSTNSISVISAIGTRPYYKKFGYELNGPYVTKEL